MTDAGQARLGWVVLAVALVLVPLTGGWAGRDSWPLLSGADATDQLAAESLVADFDLLYDDADYDRFFQAAAPRPLTLSLRQKGGEGSEMAFDRRLLYPLLLALLVPIAGGSATVVLNTVLLALTAFFGARALRRLVGPTAPFWMLALLFGTPLFLLPLTGGADLLALLAMTLGLSWVERVRPPAASELKEIYDVDLSQPAGRKHLRWAAAGAVFAVPVLFYPLAALVVLAVLVPRKETRIAALAGLLVVLVPLVGLELGLGGTPFGWGGQAVSLASAGDTGETIAAAAPDLRHLAWNVLFTGVGLKVGVLFDFLPAWVLLAVAGRLERELQLRLMAVFAALVTATLLAPFNFFAGGPLVHTANGPAPLFLNRFFLCLFPVFWFLPRKRLDMPAAIGTLLVGAVTSGAFLFVVPQSLQHTDLWAKGSSFSTPVLARIPYETTQRYASSCGVSRLPEEALRTGCVSNGEVAANHRITLPKGQGSLWIGSQKALEAVLIEVDQDLSSDLEVVGGKLEQLLLRPAGGIGYEVSLGSGRRHLGWWHGEEAYFYTLSLRFPVAEAVTLSVRSGRSRDIAEVTFR